jgi:hypothetical protein
MLIEDEPSNETQLQFNSKTNRALHSMAAHLYRYGSELAMLAETVKSIVQYHTDFHQTYVERGIRTAERPWTDCNRIVVNYPIQGRAST